MNEQAVLIGPARSLVGIITDPPARSPLAEPLGAILLNAGMVHRVGPNRCHVKIARRLAASGIVTLRFDLSGLGDSAVRADGLPFERSSIEETREAIDYLSRERGVRQFVLIGLCSGADCAFFASLDDPRVVGLVLVDPFIASFPVLGFYARTYLRNLLRPSSWWRFVSGRSLIWGPALKQILTYGSAPPAENDATGGLQTGPAILEGTSALLARGVSFLFVYSAETAGYDNYRFRIAPVIERFARTANVTVRRFERSDHEFTLLAPQKALVALIHDWARELATTKSAAAASVEAATRKREVG